MIGAEAEEFACRFSGKLLVGVFASVVLMLMGGLLGPSNGLMS